MPAQSSSSQDISSQILFEDNHLIVLNKQNGQIVQGDKTGDMCLADMVKAYLKKKYSKPGNVYCGVVHRLDRPVSGVLIMAKTDKALSRLNNQIKERQIKKTYWAITRNAPPQESGILRNYLYRNEKQNKSYIVESGSASQYAELSYRLICKSDHYNLLEIDLMTGRHHQIRVQLAGMGCPIKGDLKYGFGRSNRISSISLHARQIAFNHPVTKEHLVITAPAPAEPLWQYFESACRCASHRD
ncbi:MAG: RluA family pseudouridine synthase [Bacteroidales bacterium]|jgi:23S rRNA pseudouridine1911/1915/1917 synthase|nr:RluA family pseudouridine synthase [Bacteroidales bacterium]